MHFDPFPMQDFNGLLVCYSWGLPATYPAEKHSVAICLRSSHNLTELYSTVNSIKLVCTCARARPRTRVVSDKHCYLRAGM